MESKVEHQLAEVVCGFWFNPSQNPWDATYFGKFYEQILPDGYTEKQEQVGFQVKLELNKNEPEKPSAQADKLEPRMLFKNPIENKAILMAANYISFHKLPPYNSWETFVEEQIKPGLAHYGLIGLGNGLLRVHMLYLNRYIFDQGVPLNDIFKFLPSVETLGVGKEKSLLFQSQYELDPNLLLQIKLNSAPISGEKKQVFLECSCLGTNFEGRTDLLPLISIVHETNNKVFQTITKQ